MERRSEYGSFSALFQEPREEVTTFLWLLLFNYVASYNIGYSTALKESRNNVLP
ncbi:hypothetical protein J6590_073994 [Homalodisca vitripennis]|nr:hypothetical protein J6590_073994 [Homalodisca vitripennis]